MKPNIAPTSSVPSSVPSRTGLVASFEVTATVTASLSDSEIDAIEAELLADEVTTTGIEIFSSYQTFFAVYIECHIRLQERLLFHLMI